MATVRKYSFDTVFETPSASGDGRRARGYTDVEIATIKAQALAEGREAGRRDAAAAIEAAIERTLERIAAECAAQRPTLASRAEDARKSVLEVAIALCRKVLPALAEQGAAEEIARLVGATLVELAEEPRVVVRVAPALVEALAARLRPIEAGFPGKLVLLGDETIAVGDCSVLWADGGVERDRARILTAIDAAVARHLAQPASPPGAEPSVSKPTNT